MLIFIFIQLGVACNIVELCCYIIFFAHVTHHDNHIAVTILGKEVIRQRNQTNAVTMVGLFLTWLMELSYLSWITFYYGLDFSKQSRELPTLVKMSEFSLVPLVQIMTSPPLRRFVSNR